MPAASTNLPGDPRLARFLSAASPAAAEAALVSLLEGETDRLLKEAVRRAARNSAWGRDHAEEIASDVRLRLIRKLRALKRGEGEPIENLHAYVVSAATRTCYAFLRERHPERTRLRNRVRYAVSHHSDTGLTVDASGTSQCVARKAVRAVPAAGATISFLDAPATFLSKHRISTADSLPAVIAAVLERLDSPIDLDRLVDGLAVAFGIVELEAPPPREPDPE